MADEARAMLDALMGADRNASQQQQPSEHERGGGPKRKRSCYDPAVCPLYCAWGGTDLHELFRNTKSDLGQYDKAIASHEAADSVEERREEDVDSSELPREMPRQATVPT